MLCAWEESAKLASRPLEPIAKEARWLFKQVLELEAELVEKGDIIGVLKKEIESLRKTQEDAFGSGASFGPNHPEG